MAGEPTTADNARQMFLLITNENQSAPIQIDVEGHPKLLEATDPVDSNVGDAIGNGVRFFDENGDVENGVLLTDYHFFVDERNQVFSVPPGTIVQGRFKVVKNDVEDKNEKDVKHSLGDIPSAPMQLPDTSGIRVDSGEVLEHLEDIELEEEIVGNCESGEAGSPCSSDKKRVDSRSSCSADKHPGQSGRGRRKKKLPPDTAVDKHDPAAETYTESQLKVRNDENEVGSGEDQPCKPHCSNQIKKLIEIARAELLKVDRPLTASSLGSVEETSRNIEAESEYINEVTNSEMIVCSNLLDGNLPGERPLEGDPADNFKHERLSLGGNGSDSQEGCSSSSRPNNFVVEIHTDGVDFIEDLIEEIIDRAAEVDCTRSSVSPTSEVCHSNISPETCSTSIAIDFDVKEATSHTFDVQLTCQPSDADFKKVESSSDFCRVEIIDDEGSLFPRRTSAARRPEDVDCRAENPSKETVPSLPQVVSSSFDEKTSSVDVERNNFNLGTSCEEQGEPCEASLEINSSEQERVPSNRLGGEMRRAEEDAIHGGPPGPIRRDDFIAERKMVDRSVQVSLTSFKVIRVMHDWAAVNNFSKCTSDASDLFQHRSLGARESKLKAMERELEFRLSSIKREESRLETMRKDLEIKIAKSNAPGGIRNSLGRHLSYSQGDSTESGSPNMADGNSCTNKHNKRKSDAPLDASCKKLSRHAGAAKRLKLASLE